MELIEIGDVIATKPYGKGKRIMYEVSGIDKISSVAQDYWVVTGVRLVKDKWHPGEYVSFGWNKGFFVRIGEDAPFGYENIGRLR